MSPKFTGGRRSIAVVFAAIITTTVACGTQKGSDAQDVVQRAPAAVKQAPFHSSADAEERKWAKQGGRFHGSADAEERKRANQESQKTSVPGKRVPDARA